MAISIKTGAVNVKTGTGYDNILDTIMSPSFNQTVENKVTDILDNEAQQIVNHCIQNSFDDLLNTKIDNRINDVVQEPINNYLESNLNDLVIPVVNDYLNTQDFSPEENQGMLHYVTPQQFMPATRANDDTDDAKYIQMAIDDAYNKGYKVYLHGSYNCQTTIYCHTNTIIEGCGDGRIGVNKEMRNNKETQIISTANPAICIGSEINETNNPMRGHTSIKDIKIITGYTVSEAVNRTNQVGVQINFSDNGNTAWKNYLENCTIRSFGIGLQFSTIKNENCGSENLFLHCKIYDCVIGVQSVNYNSFNNTFIQTDIQSMQGPTGAAIDIAHGGSFYFYGCSIMKRGPVVRIRNQIEEAQVTLNACRIEVLSYTSGKVYMSNEWEGYSDGENNYTFYYPYVFGIVNPQIQIPTTIGNNIQLEATLINFPTNQANIVYHEKEGSNPAYTVTTKQDISNNNQYQYQWQSRENQSANWEDINGATNKTYTLANDNDTNKDFRCKIKNGLQDIYYSNICYGEGHSATETIDIFEKFYIGRSRNKNCLLNVTNTYIYIHSNSYIDYLFQYELGGVVNFNNILVGYAGVDTHDIILTKLNSIKGQIGRIKVPYIYINANNVYGVKPAQRDIYEKEYCGTIKQTNVQLKSPTTVESDNKLPIWQIIPIDYDIGGYGVFSTQIKCIKFGRNNVDSIVVNDTRYAFKLPPYITLTKIGIKNYGNNSSNLGSISLYAVSDNSVFTLPLPEGSSVDNPPHQQDWSEILIGNYAVLDNQYVEYDLNQTNASSQNNSVLPYLLTGSVESYKQGRYFLIIPQHKKTDVYLYYI